MSQQLFSTSRTTYGFWMFRRLVLVAGYITGLLSAISSRAEVRLPAIFGDHMVLQRDASVPVWGWAVPSEKVAVEIAGAAAETVTGADGRWRVALDLSRLGAGPFELVVTGNNREVLNNVLVGEVWLASGQSNMEFALSQSIGGTEAAAGSSNSMLRFFKVARRPAMLPQDDTAGKWIVSGPGKVESFSAIGYHFGRDLQRTLGGPVAVIDTSIGGTQAESWMSAEAIAATDGLTEGRDRLEREVNTNDSRLADFRRAYPEWERLHGREDRQSHPVDFLALGKSLEGWKPASLPAKFVDLGLSASGAIWFRKSIQVTPGMAKEALRIDLGDINGFVEVFWDGERIGQTDFRGYPGLETRFTYMVPKSRVNEGDAVLTVRVRTPGTSGELKANAAGSNFRVIRDALNRQFLAGEWLAKVEYALPPLKSAALAAMPVEPPLPPIAKSMASALFNGLIHPIVPFGIRGVIWYQGEGNAGRAWQYRTTFPALINDWRTQWSRAGLPFYFCQLANFGPMSDAPGESAWAELREAQALSSALPHTGMAVLIDVGEEADIHPRNKTTVGDRLARLALVRDYGKSVVPAAPIYHSVSLENGSVRVHFRPSNEHLVAGALPDHYQPRTTEHVTKPLPRHTPGKLQGFALCGDDRIWVWADEAYIDGATVIVRSAKVPKPIAVRYAWADNPVCNLYGSHGLPVAPFRSDSFPSITRDVRY